VHRLDNGLGLALHVAGKVCVDHVLILHRRRQCDGIEHVSIDDSYPLRIRVLEPCRATQVQHQSGIGGLEEHVGRVAGGLAVRAED
jgi:hypothetical protein